jgi:hypothetical protein
MACFQVSDKYFCGDTEEIHRSSAEYPCGCSSDLVPHEYEAEVLTAQQPGSIKVIYIIQLEAFKREVVV